MNTYTGDAIVQDAPDFQQRVKIYNNEIHGEIPDNSLTVQTIHTICNRLPTIAYLCGTLCRVLSLIKEMIENNIT